MVDVNMEQMELTAHAIDAARQHIEDDCGMLIGAVDAARGTALGDPEGEQALDQLKQFAIMIQQLLPEADGFQRRLVYAADAFRSAHNVLRGLQR